MLNKSSGFSLIELMIGLVIGLVISGAVMVFISATLKANNETVQSMKLNHELRALSEIISRDVRRARGMADPIANIGSNCSTTAGASNACQGLAFNAITIPSAPNNTCIVYAYDSPDLNNYRAVRLATTSGVGSVFFDRSTTPRSCSSGGIKISSDLIDIDSLIFSNCTYVDTSTSTTKTLADCINITVSGKLINDQNAIVQTYKSSIGIRSGLIN
jgi:prepilin-type N-terminal cleavage/methylation domain-containing protein